MLSSIIVIPIYKSLPNTYEMVSYARFLKIMNTHQVCFVTHKELDITWYTKQLTERCIPFEVAFFDEKYFKSVSNYSKLLLSKKFYQAFVAYNYLLIFQLDVYIFKDSLEDWIQKGYSYIGAPWILKKENEFIVSKQLMWLRLVSQEATKHSWKFRLSQPSILAEDCSI